MRTPPLSPAEGSLNLPLPRPPAWIWLFTTQIGPPASWLLHRNLRAAAPARPSRWAHRIHATAPWPGIREYSSEHAPRPPPGGDLQRSKPLSALVYHIPDRCNMVLRADHRPQCRPQRPSRSGAIFLQASTRPCTAPTD